MKKSAKNSPPPAANPPPPAWEWVYALQEARQPEALAQTLAAATETWTEPGRFRLLYHAGPIREQVVIRRGRTVRQEADPARFRRTKPGFTSRLDRRRLLISEDGEFARMRLELTAGPDPRANAALRALARAAFGQLRLLLRIRQQEAEAVKDDLTAAYNQNYLKKFVNDEIARYRRSPAPFAVVFVDLDNLKDINERFCHLVGSQVLKEVAAIFMGAVRKTDLVARFGGDEFVVVLLHTGLEQAQAVCRRIRAALNGAVLARDDRLDIRITASYGISAMSPRVQSADDIIREADQAMYQVKNSGKNAIRIHQGD